MPNPNNKKICTELLNQWTISTACLPKDIYRSQEFLELQRMFWKCAYGACYEEQPGQDRNTRSELCPNYSVIPYVPSTGYQICTGILIFSDTVLALRPVEDCLWLMRLMLGCAFSDGASLFQYFNAYADTLGGVSTLIEQLLFFKYAYGRDEWICVVESIYSVMKHPLLFEMNGLTHGYQELMHNRIQLYSRYRQTLYESLCGSEQVYLEASSGDFHNAMLNPVFIRFQGKKDGYVFKPRDMRVDRAVADMITFFRPKLQPLGVDLPAPEILLSDDTRIREKFPNSQNLAAQFETDCGYMRLYQGSGKISLEMADAYFQKMGALLLISILCGVKDLHNENIMAAGQGPVIIDGECAFQYDFMRQNNMDEGGLILLFGGFRFFYQNHYWREDSGDNNAFPEVEGGKIYEKLKESMMAGFAKAQEALLKIEEDALWSKFWKAAGDSCIRILPISTGSLGRYVLDYLTYKNLGNEVEQFKMVRCIVGNFLLGIYRIFGTDTNPASLAPLKDIVDRWILSTDKTSGTSVPKKDSDAELTAAVCRMIHAGDRQNLNLTLLKELIQKDCALGVIPIFRYHIASGNIYADACSTPILTIGITQAQYREILQRQKAWLQTPAALNELNKRI